MQMSFYILAKNCQISNEGAGHLRLAIHVSAPGPLISIIIKLDESLLIKLGQQIQNIEVIERIVVAVAAEDEVIEADYNPRMPVPRRRSAPTYLRLILIVIFWGLSYSKI